MDYVKVDKEKCALCGLCAASCPFEAIEFKIDDVNIKEMKHTLNGNIKQNRRR